MSSISSGTIVLVSPSGGPAHGTSQQRIIESIALQFLEQCDAAGKGGMGGGKATTTVDIFETPRTLVLQDTDLVAKSEVVPHQEDAASSSASAISSPPRSLFASSLSTSMAILESLGNPAVIGTVAIANKYFHQTLSIVSIDQSSSSSSKKHNNASFSSSSDDSDGGKGGGGYHSFEEDDQHQTAPLAEESSSSSSSSWSANNGGDARAKVRGGFDRNAYESLASDNDNDDDDASEENNAYDCTEHGQSTAATTTTATRAVSSSPLSPATTTATTTPIALLGPILGIVTISQVPNYRLFYELDEEEQNGRRGKQNSTVDAAAADVDNDFSNLTLTNKRRRQLTQQREREAEQQKVLANRAMDRASMLVNDLHFVLMLTAQREAVRRCVALYPNHQNQQQHEQEEEEGAVDDKRQKNNKLDSSSSASGCADWLTHLGAAAVLPSISVEGLQDQIQMRALALITARPQDKEDVDDADDGAHPTPTTTTPPSYVLDAWHDACLDHFHELIEVRLSSATALKKNGSSSPLPVPLSLSENNKNITTNNNNNNGYGAADSQPAAHAIIEGVSRLVSLALYETPWPMGAKAWRQQVEEVVAKGVETWWGSEAMKAKRKACSTRAAAAKSAREKETENTAADEPSSDYQTIDPSSATTAEIIAGHREAKEKEKEDGATIAKAVSAAASSPLPPTSPPSPFSFSPIAVFITVSDASDRVKAVKVARYVLGVEMGLRIVDVKTVEEKKRKESHQRQRVGDGEESDDTFEPKVAFYIHTPPTKMDFPASHHHLHASSSAGDRNQRWGQRSSVSRALIPVIVVDGVSLHTPLSVLNCATSSSSSAPSSAYSTVPPTIKTVLHMIIVQWETENKAHYADGDDDHQHHHTQHNNHAIVPMIRDALLYRSDVEGSGADATAAAMVADVPTCVVAMVSSKVRGGISATQNKATSSVSSSSVIEWYDTEGEDLAFMLEKRIAKGDEEEEDLFFLAVDNDADKDAKKKKACDDDALPPIVFPLVTPAVALISYNDDDGDGDDDNACVAAALPLYSYDSGAFVGGAKVSEWIAHNCAVLMSSAHHHTADMMGGSGGGDDGSGGDDDHHNSSSSSSNDSLSDSDDRRRGGGCGNEMNGNDRANRVLIVLADSASAHQWDNAVSSDSSLSDSSSNVTPKTNGVGKTPQQQQQQQQDYSWYKSNFFASSAAFPFAVAPTRAADRIAGLSSLQKKKKTESVADEESYYYIAPDVTVDVVTAFDYVRCLYRRKVMDMREDAMLHHQHQHQQHHSGEKDHCYHTFDDGDDDANAPFNFSNEQFKACQSQYAAVIVIGASSRTLANPSNDDDNVVKDKKKEDKKVTEDKENERLTAIAAWAKANVYSLYSTEVMESEEGDDEGHADEDGVGANTIGGGMSALTTTATTATANTTASLFLVIDTASIEEGGDGDGDGDGDLTTEVSAEPFYGDFFLFTNNDEDDEENDTSDADDKGGDSNHYGAVASTAATNRRYVNNNNREVEVVWLSDFIEDLKSDAILHNNNTLSSSSSASSIDGEEEDNVKDFVCRGSPLSPSHLSSSSSRRGALNELFRQTLDRAPWPRKRATGSSNDGLSNTRDALLLPPSRALAPLAAQKRLIDDKPQTIISAAAGRETQEQQGMASAAPPPSSSSSSTEAAAPVIGCVPPPYLFVNPDSGKTEIILIKFAPPVNNKLQKVTGTTENPTTSLDTQSHHQKETKKKKGEDEEASFAYDLTAIPSLASSFVMDQLMKDAYGTTMSTPAPHYASVSLSKPITTRLHDDSTMNANNAHTADGSDEASPPPQPPAARPLRFPLERYVTHDHMAMLMRTVKEKGTLLHPAERQRQAAVLAEALGSMMMNVDGDDSDDNE